MVLPDRPTFFHFAPARPSPSARFDKNQVEEVRPPPFRAVHERLGISAEEFEACLVQEIDSVLDEGRSSRTQELKSDDLSSPVEMNQPLTVMTKADCLRLLGHQALTTGSLLGMYYWAADLGWARYRYDFDLNRDDTDLLNAFD